MIPETPFSSHTARMAFSSAPDRSGEIFTTSGFGAVPASLPMAYSNSESFSGSCRLAQTRCVWRADIQRDVIGKIPQHAKRVKVIVCRLLERSCSRLADVDSHWNGRPSAAFTQRRQSVRNRVRAVVVETKPIDQRLLLGQSKNARLGVSRLRLCRHGPNLDKTESERCPCGKSNTVFVQPSRESNWVWEV